MPASTRALWADGTIPRTRSTISKDLKKFADPKLESRHMEGIIERFNLYKYKQEGVDVYKRQVYICNVHFVGWVSDVLERSRAERSRSDERSKERENDGLPK